jgi:hypothetical protein
MSQHYRYCQEKKDFESKNSNVVVSMEKTVKKLSKPKN